MFGLSGINFLREDDRAGKMIAWGKAIGKAIGMSDWDVDWDVDWNVDCEVPLARRLSHVSQSCVKLLPSA